MTADIEQLAILRGRAETGTPDDARAYLSALVFACSRDGGDLLDESMTNRLIAKAWATLSAGVRQFALDEVTGRRAGLEKAIADLPLIRAEAGIDDRVWRRITAAEIGEAWLRLDASVGAMTLHVAAAKEATGTYCDATCGVCTEQSARHAEVVARFCQARDAARLEHEKEATNV